MNDREPIEIECDHCHPVKMCVYASDPYISEVRERETELSYWCDDCYSSRHDEV